MQNNKWLRRTPAQLSLLVLLATAACSGGEEAAPEEDPAEEESQQEDAAAIPPEELSGLVILNELQADITDTGVNETILTFHDLEDGSLNARLDLTEVVEAVEDPDDMGTGLSLDGGDFAFSPGFRDVAFESEVGIIVGSLDDESYSYVPSGTIAPEEDASFEGGEITYESPQFTPDAEQVWFEEYHEHGDDDSRILGVDTGAADAEPEHIGDAPSASRAPATIEGTAAHGNTWYDTVPSNAYVITEEHELETLTHDEDDESGAIGGEEGLEANLEFLAGDDGSILPWNFVPGPDGQFIGDSEESWAGDTTELSLFSLDADGTVSDEEVLLETEGNAITNYWYDEQGERLLLQTSDSYYLHEIGDSGEPTPAFDEPDFEADTEHHATGDNSLGIFPPHEG